MCMILVRFIGGVATPRCFRLLLGVPQRGVMERVGAIYNLTNAYNKFAKSIPIILQICYNTLYRQ